MADMTTSGLIDSRQGTHGEFMENSRATWEIMRVLQAERNWAVLPDNMKHAMYMIAHKMARIVAGNPEERDHWMDIAGYATLVEQRIEKPVAPVDIGSDLYMALAVTWNCSRDEAKKRALAVLHSGKAGAESSAQAQMRADKAEQYRIDMEKAEQHRVSIMETVNDAVRKTIGELDLRNKGGL